MPYPQFMVSIITTMFHSVLKREHERITICSKALLRPMGVPDHLHERPNERFRPYVAFFRPKKLRNCNETFGNGRERLTV